MKGRARKEVRIPRELRPIIGRAIIKHLNEDGYRVLALSVAKVHAHGLTELPHELARVKVIVGEAKRVSSRAVKKQLPGSIWAADGTYKPVLNPRHERASFEYILYEQGDAWTWSYRDGNLNGTFGRKRPLPRNRSGAALRRLRSAPAWRGGNA